MSVALLQAGNGIIATVLPRRLSALGADEWRVGLITAALYVGLLLGTGLAPWLLHRVGHRAGTMWAAALVAVSSVALADQVGPLCALARGGGGLALAIIFVALESWLAETASVGVGRAMTAYMATTYAALSVSPWLVQAGAGFGVGAALIGLSLAPVALMEAEPLRSATPATPGAARRSVSLHRRSPCGAAAALASGITTGALLTLLPLYCLRTGLDGGQASLFLSAPLVVGLLLQAPLGRWLDALAPRIVTGRLAGALIVSALLASWGPGSLRWSAAAVAGGLVFGLYPLALALVHARLEATQRVAGNAAILRLWGVGAASGPVAAGTLMGVLGPEALYVLVATCGVGLGAVAYASKNTELHSEPGFGWAHRVGSQR